MAKSIFNLSVTDAWNSNADLLTPCTTKKIALKLAKQDAKNKNKPLSEWDCEFLANTNQTQGRAENYLIEEVEINVLPTNLF